MYNDPSAKDLLAQYPRQLAEGGDVAEKPKQSWQAPVVEQRKTSLTPIYAPSEVPAGYTGKYIDPTVLSASQQYARDIAAQDAMLSGALSSTGNDRLNSREYSQLQQGVRSGDITQANLQEKVINPAYEARVRNAYAAIGRTGAVLPELVMPATGKPTAANYQNVTQAEYDNWLNQLKSGTLAGADFQNKFLTANATAIPTTNIEAQMAYVNKARAALGMPLIDKTGKVVASTTTTPAATNPSMGNIALFSQGGDVAKKSGESEQTSDEPRSMDLEQFLLENSRTRLGPVDVQEVRSARGPGKYDTRISKNLGDLEAYADLDVGGKKFSQLGARLMGQGRIGNYEVQYMYDPETKQPVITGAVRKELSPTSDISAEGVYVPQKDGKDYYNAGVRYTKRFAEGGEATNENVRTLRSIDVTPEDKLPMRKKEVGHPNEYVDTVARWGRKGQEGFATMIGLGDEVKFANAIPEYYFPKDEQLDGRGDAMRHMLLQAQITKKLGRTPAEIASYIHENWLTGGQSKEEKAMDEANDALGMDIGSRATDKADMAYQALQAIKAGQAKTIAKKTKK
jgi:hypothetical protein